MCLGGGSSPTPQAQDTNFTVNPVPPNVIDGDDVHNFPDTPGAKDQQKAVPKASTKTSATGLQIPSNNY